MVNGETAVSWTYTEPHRQRSGLIFRAVSAVSYTWYEADPTGEYIRP